jgi:L-lactate dehydrogenase complex protein LldE
MRVGLFITCLTDTFYPQTGRAVVDLLRHCGCEVIFPPGQTCCGQPAYNNGLPSLAAPFIHTLANLFHDVDHIVTPSASCAAMIHEHGRTFTTGNPTLDDRIEHLVTRTADVNHFLAHINPLDASMPRGDLNDLTIAYHYPCHTRAFRSADEARRLVSALLDTEVHPIERFDQCCGFGGAFCMEHASISGVMVQDKIACIQRAQPDILICDEAGCRMNIEGALHRAGTSIRVAHTIELLAEALTEKGAPA